MSPEVEAIAQRHQPYLSPVSAGPLLFCSGCKASWPCDTALVLAELGWNPDTDDTDA